MSILKLIFLFTLQILIKIVLSINIQNNTITTKLENSYSFEIKEGCKEIIIPNNYKKLIMNLEATDLDRIIITDQKIEKCVEDKEISKCCSRNSTFCIENVNPTKNEFRLNYCIDYTYVYACIIDEFKNMRGLRVLEEEININNTNDISINKTDEISINNTGEISINNTINDTIINNVTINDTYNEPKTGSLQLKISVIKGQGCQTTEFVPETECSSIGLTSCKDPNKCLPKCTYIECRTELNDPLSKVFAMCLPANLSEMDITNRCRNHIKFTDNNITPKLYKKICENKEEENNYIPEASSHTFFKFILVVFGVIILATFIASVYYRFKISMDGVAPFESPHFIPNFIFPRAYNYY